MLELSDPPALASSAVGSIAASSRRNMAAQATLRQRLSGLGATVLFQASLSYNGLAVLVDSSQIANLRALPGVRAVHTIAPKLRANADAVAFIGAPSVWQAAGGATGRGIRVGVIDSGIDYTHADFGGAGTAAAYAANDRTLIEPGSFPTAKVIGGWDLAGDTYDAGSALASRRIPTPDPDPLDCNGHGTQVAGTLAGFGVAEDGSTYSGSYSSTLDLSSFRVGPGVAPEAQLYALKIFGCDGSTALLTQAIERALDPNGDGDPSDHLDVLNISLGSSFGGDDDPDAIAVDNAVRAGVVVVASAGDTGEIFYAGDSPASASLAIAVGASVDSARATPPITTTDSLASFSSRGPQRGNAAIKPDLVAPGVELRSAAVGSGTEASSISGTSIAAPQAAGAAALLLQLHPGWEPAKVKAALIDTAAPVHLPGGEPAPPSLVGAGRLDLTKLTSLSLLAYDGATDAGAGGLMYGAPWISQTSTLSRSLRLDNLSALPRTVTLSATTTVSETGVALQLPSDSLEIAPHSSITVPVSLTLDPQLLDFTPDAATALEQDGFARYFMAEHGGRINIQSGHDGVRVRPAHAAHLPSVDFYLDDQLLDDSLDSREVHSYSDTTSGEHTVRIRLPCSSTHAPSLFEASVMLENGHDYTLILVGRSNELGLVVVDETTDAPPEGQALMHVVNANRQGKNWDIGPIDVYLDGALYAQALPVGQASPFKALEPGAHTIWFFQTGADPSHDRALVRKTFDVVAGELLLVGTGRHDDDDRDLYDYEQRAFIGRSSPRTDTPLVLSVPFTVFPKAAAAAHAADSLVAVAASADSFSVGLRNSGARNAGLDSGGLGGPHTPLVSAFELEASSPQISGLSDSVRTADVEYVGVTSDYSVTQSITSSRVFFGLATYAPWSTPNDVDLRVYIDADRDGIDDYMILNTNSSVFFTTPSDVFINPVYKILPGGGLEGVTFSFWSTWQPPTGSQGYGLEVSPFNTSVMFQSISAGSLGLTDAQTRFYYHVETYARDANNFGELVDRVPSSGVLEYDVAHPAIAPINTSESLFVRRPLFLDVDGGHVSGAVNTAILSSRKQQSLLLLHHHNVAGDQAELLVLNGPAVAPGSVPNKVHSQTDYTVWIPAVQMGK